MALPDRIAVEDFFGPPERAGARISPDGTRIAYLAPWRNRLNVWVQDLDSGAEPRCVTADETRSVMNYQWTNERTPGRRRWENRPDPGFCAVGPQGIEP